MPAPVSSIALAGSRSLAGPAAAALVAGAISRLAGAGVSSWSVGCSVGADQLALSALVSAGLAPAVNVYAVGSSSGAGFWSGSALATVRAAAAAGASISWLAGGPLPVPLRARLARRSAACALAAAGLLIWFASPASRGSLVAARAAAAGDRPVWAIACGFPPALLPALAAAGAWLPALASGPLAGAWLWSPGAAQPPLF